MKLCWVKSFVVLSLNISQAMLECQLRQTQWLAHYYYSLKEQVLPSHDVNCILCKCCTFLLYNTVFQ